MFTVLIIVAIVSLCICDLAVLGLVASYVYEKSSHTRSAVKAPAPMPSDRSSGQDGSEELEKAQRDYIARERAFEGMMNFNIEQAYDMHPIQPEEYEG